MGQSTESINDTWRSVDDMVPFMEHSGSGFGCSSGSLEENKDKMSPTSYSVGRTRSTSNASCGSSHSSNGGRDPSLAPLDLSPSGKSLNSHYSSSSGGSSSGNGSLHGENISTSAHNSPHRERREAPYRERSSSNVSVNGGCPVVGRISEGSSGDNSGGGEYMFGMDDADSLENSLEDFSAFGDLGRPGHSTHQSQSQSPLTSYLTQASPLRIEFGACTRLGPKTSQEDRFVMIPTLATPQHTEQQVEGFDNESNTYRCDHSYAAVYDGE